MTSLIEKMKKGDRRAFSRLLSYVEELNASTFEILKEIWPYTGHAKTVGLTGPAGAGKSTLIDQLISELRSKGKKVGVIAVDPSSPFSGGAVLGDRVRMQKHFNDSNVFIRSVGSRGRSGGVSFATRALIQMLDAFGVDVILVETVGAGQSEVDIADLVDTTVVVLVPEAGDAIQAMKAGILEIANVFVVNKKDRAGAELLVNHIETSLSMNVYEGKWRPQIVLTEALSGDGVVELWGKIEEHQTFLHDVGLSKEEKDRRTKRVLDELLHMKIFTVLRDATNSDPEFKKRIASAQTNLYAEADDLLRNFRWDLLANRPNASSGK